MDRFVIRRARQPGADTPSSSGHPQGGRPETSVEVLPGTSSQCQSQSQTQTGPISQSQSQTQTVLGSANKFLVQTQTQNQNQNQNQTQSAEEASQSQDQGHSGVVNIEEETDSSGGVAESAPQPQRRRKRHSETQGRSAGIRKFQSRWRDQFPWLVYESSLEAAFCHICKAAFQQNCLTFASQCQMAFIQTGFRNWKKGMERFRTHERSDCHRESVYKTKALSSGVTVSAILSSAQKVAQGENREALLRILSSLKYLVVQGLAIRGHVDDTSNFVNLLRLRCEDSPVLMRWMQRTSFKWCSHEVSNEMLEIMSHHLARSLVSRIVEAKTYALMVDETADISIKEQLSICFRTVTHSLEVEERFLGFHSTTNTKSETIFNIVLDVLRRFNLPVRDCRGQCFDGARNMAGSIRGVQARMRTAEPRALFVHCMAHTLSLTVHDLVKQIPGCRNVLSLAQEVITFIRESPKRHHLFQTFQTGSDVEAETPSNLRPFCPTRWTVRCQSLSSILSNFRELMDVMEELSESERSDAGYKAHGFHRIMKTFDFYFHLSLMSKVFCYVDTVNSALQKVSLHFQEATAMIAKLSALLYNFRNGFDAFWGDVIAKTESLSLARPKMPRRRQAPSRFRDADSTDAPPPDTPKDLYRKAFSEVVDTICECISSRFQTEAADLMHKAERFLTGEDRDLHQDLQEHLRDDLDVQRLRLHRDMLLDMARSEGKSIDSIAFAVEFLKREPVYLNMLPEVRLFLRQLLTVPVSTSTAERSFSTLRRLKTYLRSTVTQKRLNHLVLLNVHREDAQDVDLDVIANEFISRNEIRRATFACKT